MTKMRIKVPEFIAYNKRGIHNVLDSRTQWMVRALDVPIALHASIPKMLTNCLYHRRKGPKPRKGPMVLPPCEYDVSAPCLYGLERWLQKIFESDKGGIFWATRSVNILLRRAPSHTARIIFRLQLSPLFYAVKCVFRRNSPIIAHLVMAIGIAVTFDEILPKQLITTKL